MGALAKHYYSLIKAGRASNKEKAKKEEQEPIFERIEKSNQELRESIQESNDNFQANLQACHTALKEEMLAHNIEQDRKMEQSHEEILQRIENLTGEIEKNNKDTAAVKSGTLALWRKTYFNDARKLLEPDHVITDKEYVKISVEHNVYNQLGGNHEGDEYFNSITIKYNSGLKNG